MRHLAICIILAATVAGCAAASPFRSSEDARAIESADLLDRDPVEFESRRPALAQDPAAVGRLARELCRRILNIEAESRKREGTFDPLAREIANQQMARYRLVIPTLGAPAAEVLVGFMCESGYGVSLGAEILAKFEDASADPAIAAAIESPRENVRRGALRAAATSESRIVHFQEAAANLLSDPAWIVRREAATILGMSKLVGDRWDDALVKVLGDDDWLVSREAAHALGRRQAMGRVGAMIEYLERAQAGNDPGAVESAIAALHDITNRKDISPDPVAWRRWLEQNQPASRPAVQK
ncbi:MAG: HEAT repeat domain-containing protein [Planctomycetes bacterium]|nr:HEAT repeat domain-containing protein [Planctomycetota bacterium]